MAAHPVLRTRTASSAAQAAAAVTIGSDAGGGTKASSIVQGGTGFGLVSGMSSATVETRSPGHSTRDALTATSTSSSSGPKSATRMTSERVVGLGTMAADRDTRNLFVG